MNILTDQLEAAERRYKAMADTDVNTREALPELASEAAIANVPENITAGNILGSAENMEKRITMLAEQAKEPVDFALERAIGKNDSVYSNFVELIHDAKQKVGRIIIKKGNKNIGYATGFMVSENLMLTNWHVFKTQDEVGDSKLQFFYEYNTAGDPMNSVSFDLQDAVFYHSNKELDYCLVAVNTKDETGRYMLKDIGYIYIDPGLGKLGNEGEESLNIIHHPDGDYKQLSIRENLFVKITPTSVWYHTDTAPGSSGSPVFNDQWQVVALHHMGVAKKNNAGNYVDREGKEIPEVDGKIDASKVVWIANEGIRISVIMKDLFTTFPDTPILQGMKQKPAGVADRKPAPDIERASGDILTASKNTVMDNNGNTINISLPASLLDKSGHVQVNISNGNAAIAAATVTAAGQSDEALQQDEIKKLEGSTDYSKCKGYQPGFMGVNHKVDMPMPLKALQKFIAKLKGTDSMVLKYYNYSVVFHTVRMMPVISAVNVDGDPAKRKDEEKRKDNWLRDTRINIDVQLDDAYYKGSGFDKGHMSRREDANWGATAADAKRNADLTCMYTNACPQVGKLNQSGKKGLWGILEKVVLENGAIQENGKTAKITVFNGPIFKEDDPVYKGIQVPMDFYKIVLWLTDNGALKATAFKLTQQNDVSNIDFEELDVDQNTEFREYQCSIKWLQKATNIDFSKIAPFDTFEGKEADAAELKSEQELATHISKYKKRKTR